MNKFPVEILGKDFINNHRGPQETLKNDNKHPPVIADGFTPKTAPNTWERYKNYYTIKNYSRPFFARKV